MENQYLKELIIAKELASLAGRAILEVYFGKMDKRLKADGTPVTNADIISNQIIVEGLQKSFPKDGIVSEEMDDVQGLRKWYIDPLDGTKGFTNRTDNFAVHIGLVEEDSPILGVVYKPTTGECYYATKGQGAYRKNPTGSEMRLKVNPEFNKEPLVISGSNHYFKESFNLELSQKLNPNKVINSGSEGLRVMKVAEGLADVHFSNDGRSCNTWDLCAPQAIAEEAGAYVKFSTGQPILYFGQHKLGDYFLVAANEDLGRKVSAIIEEIRKL